MTDLQFFFNAVTVCVVQNEVCALTQHTSESCRSTDTLLLKVGLTLADAVVVGAAVSGAHAVLRAVTPAVGHPSLSAAHNSSTVSITFLV